MSPFTREIGSSRLSSREVRTSEIPNTWDQDTDVVVVGSGFSGLAAAIEVHDAGSKAILLEKNPFIGGNSIIASGAYNAVDPKRQKKQGIEDSIELHYWGYALDSRNYFI